MILVFDVGGTKLRYAFSEDGKELSEPVVVPSPASDFNEAKRLFADIKSRLPRAERIEAVVAGVAGPLDKERGMLVNSPNLPGWIRQPLKEELELAFEAPVTVENDTALVGLGEAVRGAAKGYPIAVYITVSTGIGGVRIVDGKIDRNALGFEPGHQIVEAKSTVLCPGPTCGLPGHLEAYASGTALKARYGKEPSEIEDEKVWDEAAFWLAIGLNNSIVHWSPDAVVLGGSMITKVPGISLETTVKYLKETLHIFPTPPVITKGTLGDVGGLYGGLALAAQL